MKLKMQWQFGSVYLLIQILANSELSLLNTAIPYLKSWMYLNKIEISYKQNIQITDRIFNNFLNTYLRIFYSSFPLKKIHYKSCTKAWITPGIKISCLNKKKLFLLQRDSNDPTLKSHYKKYCRILTDIIKLAKQKYVKILTCSNNRTKTTWNIIRNNSNIKPNSHKINSINVNDNLSYNGHTIAKTLNKYFVSVAQHTH